MPVLNCSSMAWPMAPKLAIGDGALSFWKAMSTAYPATAHPRYRVHKTGIVLNKPPKSG